MTGRSVLYKLSLLLLLAGILSGQSFPERRIDSLLRTGLAYLNNQDYTNARLCFDSLATEYPDRATGKIYLAGTEILKEYDLKVNNDADKIFDLLDEAVDIAEENLDRDDGNIWYKYEMAVALGFKSYYYALEGDYLSALTEGVYSLNYFNDCLASDPEFYDAYVALGSYKYWKSEYGKSLLWIPFVEDERDEGVALLKKAIDKKSYHSYMAVHSLAWVYLLSDRDSLAVDLVSRVLEEYPGNRVFGILMGRSYYNIDKNMSIMWYDKVLKSYQANTIRSKIREIELKNKIAVLYEVIGKNELALDYINDILGYKLNDYEEDYLEDRMERVEEMKDRLEKNIRSGK